MRLKISPLQGQGHIVHGKSFFFLHVYILLLFSRRRQPATPSEPSSMRRWDTTWWTSPQPPPSAARLCAPLGADASGEIPDPGLTSTWTPPAGRWCLRGGPTGATGLWDGWGHRRWGWWGPSLSASVSQGTRVRAAPNPSRDKWFKKKKKIQIMFCFGFFFNKNEWLVGASLRQQMALRNKRLGWTGLKVKAVAALVIKQHVKN